MTAKTKRTAQSQAFQAAHRVSDFGVIRDSISGAVESSFAAGRLLIKWTGLPSLEKPVQLPDDFPVATGDNLLTLQQAQELIQADGGPEVSIGQLSRYRLQAVAGTLLGRVVGRPAAVRFLRAEGYLPEAGESTRGGRKSKGETELRAEVQALLGRLQDVAKGKGAKARKAVYASVQEELAKLS